MKPLDRKSTSHGRSRGRLRTLMRGRLGWLEGVPLQGPNGLLWQPLNQGGAEPDLVVVDGHLISRSERCIKTLLADHRAALRREVGDIDYWQQRTHAALVLVHELQRGRARIDSNPLLKAGNFDKHSHKLATQLLHHQPQLETLLWQLGWYWFAALESPLDILKVLERHADSLQRISNNHPLLAFRTLLLLHRFEADCDGLLTLLASPVLQLSQPRDYELHKVRRQIKKRELPCASFEQDSGDTLVAAMELLWWLQRHDDKALKQAVRLLNTLRMETLTRECLAWNAELQAIILRTQNIVKTVGWEEDQEGCQQLYDRIKILTDDPAPWCDFKLLIEAVAHVTADPVIAAPAQRLLEIWQQRIIRPASAAAWLAYLPRWLEDSHKPLPHWLRQLARLSKQAQGAALEPWQNLQKMNYWSFPDRDVLDECPDQTQQERLCDTLLALEQQGNAAAKAMEVDLLTQLLPLSNDMQLMERFVALQRAERSDQYHNHRHIELAHKLELAVAAEQGVSALDDAPARAAEFVTNMQLCKEFTNQNEWVDGLDELVQLWASLLPRSLVTELLRGSAPPVLKQCARELHFLQLDKQTITRQLHDPLTPVPDSKVPSWVRDYPSELQPLLEQLAMLDPNASRSAAKLLSKDLPRPNDIRTEIAGIRKRLEAELSEIDSPLAKRLAALEQRLQTPVPVSVKRLARLQRKLAHLVLNRRIDQFAADVHRQFLPRWAKFFGFDDANALPDWLVDPKNVRNLLYIRQLKSPSRKLGLRIVRRRCESFEAKPWDFRTDPANNHFLKELKQRGLKTTPWVDGIGSVRYTAKADNEAKLGEVRLSLADDPLQVLRMGAHFHTCLSPGGMNFFSVMANIADINKRVIYAHVGENKIVGRVLVALTDQGGLVSFHRYHHHGDWGFEEMVVDFCRQLSNAMGGVVLDGGDISCLVAHDWYDDGSEDLGGQFQALKADSPFRKSLAEISATDFLRSAEQAFGEIGLTDLTIPQLVTLPELRSNTALAWPAVQLVSQCHYPQLEVLDRVLRLAKAAEQGDAAWQQLREAMLDTCQRWIRRRKWISNNYIHTVVELDPVAGLKLLRLSREKYVRSWADESSSRRGLAAQALRKLGRPRQAALLDSVED